jgi:hypothetical protein
MSRSRARPEVAHASSWAEEARIAELEARVADLERGRRHPWPPRIAAAPAWLQAARRWARMWRAASALFQALRHAARP